MVVSYRKFIPNFSERAIVLTNLTRGKNPTKVKWLDVHEQVFLGLKQALQRPPVLRPPHWDEEFILQVDASKRGLGAILFQKGMDGEGHPVAHVSRKLQPREQTLSTTEKECLGIVWAGRVLQLIYLFKSVIPVIIMPFRT